MSPPSILTHLQRIQLLLDWWLCTETNWCTAVCNWCMPWVHGDFPYKVSAWSWIQQCRWILWVHGCSPRWDGWVSCNDYSNAEPCAYMHPPQRRAVAYPHENMPLCLLTTSSKLTTFITLQQKPWKKVPAQPATSQTPPPTQPIQPAEPAQPTTSATQTLPPTQPAQPAIPQQVTPWNEGKTGIQDLLSWVNCQPFQYSLQKVQSFGITSSAVKPKLLSRRLNRRTPLTAKNSRKQQPMNPPSKVWKHNSNQQEAKVWKHDSNQQEAKVWKHNSNQQEAKVWKHNSNQQEAKVWKHDRKKKSWAQ